MKVYTQAVEVFKRFPSKLKGVSFPHSIKIVEVSPRDGL